MKNVQTIEERCPGYTPTEKFLVWIGFYPDAESRKRLDDVGSDMDDRELEADRPPDVEKGGDVNFCVLSK